MFEIKKQIRSIRKKDSEEKSRTREYPKRVFFSLIMNIRFTAQNAIVTHVGIQNVGGSASAMHACSRFDCWYMVFYEGLSTRQKKKARKP